ncbi:hypothetical protein LTR17_007353 [Elasticomyces elasticus]|nr:hypothetical protein LTR17_007353 [Elasticomyces elasticus]
MANFAALLIDEPADDDSSSMSSGDSDPDIEANVFMCDHAGDSDALYHDGDTDMGAGDSEGLEDDTLDEDEQVTSPYFNNAKLQFIKATQVPAAVDVAGSTNHACQGGR